MANADRLERRPDELVHTVFRAGVDLVVAPGQAYSGWGNLVPRSYEAPTRCTVVDTVRLAPAV